MEKEPDTLQSEDQVVERCLRAFRLAGAGYYASRTDKDRKARSHIRQLEALGFTVTLAQAV